MCYSFVSSLTVMQSGREITECVRFVSKDSITHFVSMCYSFIFSLAVMQSESRITECRRFVSMYQVWIEKLARPSLTAWRGGLMIFRGRSKKRKAGNKVRCSLC